MDMAWLRGKESDYVLKEVALEAIKKVQTQTLECASEMIRTATIPEDRANDPTYRLAQKEFADMLHFVATGEIDLKLAQDLEADKQRRENENERKK